MELEFAKVCYANKPAIGPKKISTTNSHRSKSVASKGAVGPNMEMDCANVRFMPRDIRVRVCIFQGM